MADRYGTVDKVKTRTGVRYSDLGLDDDPALVTFIEELLDEVTDLLDRRMRRSFLEEASVPAGLDGIASDVAAEALREMVATRQTPVVRIDDFAVRTLTSRIFSPDIEKRLRLYSLGVTEIDVDTGYFTGLGDLDADTALFLAE
jgi:hypothetical protein